MLNIYRFSWNRVERYYGSFTGFLLREVCTVYFSVTADGPAPPVICGSNKGQHMIVGLYLSLCLSPRQPRLDPVQMLAVTATR